MPFSKKNAEKNRYMLKGPLARKGYDWWWHSLTAVNEETGEERPFFLEFFTCNPKLAEDTPVFGQLPENREKGKRPSYLMVKAGCWGEDSRQLHRFFPLGSVSINKGKSIEIQADDCYLSETELRGSVRVSEADAAAHPEWMCDAGEITFDLKIDKQIAFNVGYCTTPFVRFLNAFQMFWHAEGMKSKYSGTITLGGVRYKVTPETCYGYADKNWGRDFTTPWVWLSSNDLVSNITGKRLENSVFDIGGGKPKVYFIPFNRILLGAFYYEGQHYEFNFSKLWTFSHTDFSYEETEDEIIWHILQWNPKAKMETNVACRKKDMVFVNYEAPNGLKRYNHLWNGGNGYGNVKLYRKEKGEYVLVDDIAVGHMGCEYGEYDL